MNLAPEEVVLIESKNDNSPLGNIRINIKLFTG